MRNELPTRNPSSRRLLLGLVLLTAVLRIWPTPLASAELSLEQVRQTALADIFVIQDFRAGKNSFVESPERHGGLWTGKGFRYTLLDVEGQGSLRHIWTTRAGGEPFFDWEFYVDGETEPSIRGTDVQLVNAAAEFPLPVAPLNWIPVHNRAFNFYLPVPFERRLRVDVVQKTPTFWLWFCQMDYRLHDRTFHGARLVSEERGTNLVFSYVGLAQQQRSAASSDLPRAVLASPERRIRPGERVALVNAMGPGIVRELRAKWNTNATLRLLTRYDEASSFAINSPVAEFFGPFQGASFYQHRPGDHSCYLPMPFRQRCEVWIANEGTKDAVVSAEITLEKVPVFGNDWGYLHALHRRTDQTDGHRLHQVVYLRGRGHWLGMTLFRTGHDHGGGDFAVLDGEGESPSFLHGVNGEDYFTFAWFGKGGHHPYAVAHANDEGRYRHHFENVYPFQKSLALEWGAFAGLSPESVAVWYQDTPVDTTLDDGARQESVEWDVFGPMAIPAEANGPRGSEGLAILPSLRELDAGQKFVCTLVKEKFVTGWMKEWTVGPMLNLTYVARHGTRIDPESELGGTGHAFLARRFVDSEVDKAEAFILAHDDPIELWVNGSRVYEGLQKFNGFEAVRVSIPLRKGRNEIAVKLTNYFNRNFNWAGFLLRPVTAPTFQ